VLQPADVPALSVGAGSCSAKAAAVPWRPHASLGAERKAYTRAHSAEEGRVRDMSLPAGLLGSALTQCHPGISMYCVSCVDSGLRRMLALSCDGPQSPLRNQRQTAHWGPSRPW
jgi:hypothetical protein